MGSEWIEWNGGDCPIPKDTAFEVKLRSGQTSRGKPNQEWRWTKINHDGDIVAYRIVGNQ